jgi:hypothetical protein
MDKLKKGLFGNLMEKMAETDDGLPKTTYKKLNIGKLQTRTELEKMLDVVGVTYDNFIVKIQAT